MKEIVIKISDEVYKYLEKRIKFGMATEMDEIVWNGKELPKGHGELKDTTTIIDKLTDTDIYLTDSDWKELGKAIGSAETLVEADKENDK